MIENKNKSFKVELIGGPLCGLTVNWPDNEQLTMIFAKEKARYEYEGLSESGEKHTAIYRGYVEGELV